MMKKPKRGTWSFFDPVTGDIGKKVFSGNESQLEINTPAGMTPIAGTFDRESQKIDIATKLPVDYQPAQPDEHHEWNPTMKRWRKKRARVIVEAKDTGARAVIQAAESKQARVVRELLLSMQNLPAAARTRLEEVEATIVAARNDLLPP